MYRVTGSARPAVACPAFLHRAISGTAGFVPRLEEYSNGMLAAGAPSVIIQIKSGTGEWSKAAGVRSLESKEPVQLTDQVHIGDISMAMVAVSAMKLVEEGKLDLEPSHEVSPGI